MSSASRAPSSNRKDLQGKLQDLLEEGPAADQRAAVLQLFKQAVRDGQAEVRRRFDAGATGTEVVRCLCYLADQMVRMVHDHVTQRLYPTANPSTGELLSLVALGGYGRGELAPQSDIDLLFLLPYKMTPRSEQVVEEMLYLLWDVGYKVGHATRSVDDCMRLSKSDTVISTSLLEARWLWGDQGLYLELRQRYDKEIRNAGRKGRAATKFIEAKLAERDKRHKKMGDTRYSLEPNIKDGKGGLRDLHTLFWIAKFLYNVDDIAALVSEGVFTRAEVKRFQKAQSYLWILRCHLHYLTGRPEERLTFDMQMEIAPRLGYTAHAGSRDVERFMKHYFLVAKDVGDLTRIFCAALEAEHDRRSRFRLPLLAGRRRFAGFRLEGDRLTVKDPKIFAEKPTEMLRIFKVAQENDLDIHPEVLRWITQNLKHVDKALREDATANEIFLSILTSPKDPETALRRLNEAGVFGRFVPDFGRVVAQMQYNMYHHFTVDEHTIFALGILHDIEQGRLAEIAPIATEVVHKVLSRRVLYPGGSVARHRQGPARRSFRSRRARCGKALPAHGAFGRRDRDGSLAGAASSRHVPHRLSTRHRRSANHSGLCRTRAVARTPAAAAGTYRCRHSRRRPQCLECLEGLAPCGSSIGGRKRCCPAASRPSGATSV